MKVATNKAACLTRCASLPHVFTFFFLSWTTSYIFPTKLFPTVKLMEILKICAIQKLRWPSLDLKYYWALMPYVILISIGHPAKVF